MGQRRFTTMSTVQIGEYCDINIHITNYIYSTPWVELFKFYITHREDGAVGSECQKMYKSMKYVDI